MRLASLAMYASPQPVADATDVLWAFVGAFLARAGMADVPRTLDHVVAYEAAWLRPDLLLSQTCGYPYVADLRGKVRLVATPCYSYPGCDGPTMRSFVIVRTDAGHASLADLRGLTAAINSPDSNSGSNLFRALIAPLAGGPRFFGKVIETGGHVASVEAVAEGRADVAAIDCITFGHMRRFAPERLDTIAVIAETPAGPGLPLMTAASTPDEDIDLLRAALRASLAEPTLAEARETLALSGFAELADRDYEVLLDLERRAADFGYPQIA